MALPQQQAAITAFGAWAKLNNPPAFEMFTALGLAGDGGSAGATARNSNTNARTNTSTRSAGGQARTGTSGGITKETVLSYLRRRPTGVTKDQLIEALGQDKTNAAALVGATIARLTKGNQITEADGKFRLVANQNVVEAPQKRTRGRASKATAQASSAEQEPMRATG